MTKPGTHKFWVTWDERSRISQDTRYLFNLKDEEEENTFTRNDSPYDVWCWWREEAYNTAYTFGRVQGKHCFERRWRHGFNKWRHTLGIFSIQRFCPDWCDLLRGKEPGKLHFLTNVKQRLNEKTVAFQDVFKKHRSKPFVTLYKATVSTKHNVQKTVKANRKLLQRLLYAVTVGQIAEMGAIMKQTRCLWTSTMAT